MTRRTAWMPTPNILATALSGAPSRSAASTKACLDLDSRLFILTLESLYDKSRFVNDYFHMKKALKWGGKREGAGRKAEGKKSYLVSLTEKNAERAKRRTDNFSALLHGLLATWLSTRSFALVS